MNPISFGSASSSMGGSDALSEAMARRKTGQAGTTQQVTPSSSTFNPETQATQSPQQPTQSQFPFDPSEVKMIVGSLTGRLKALTKMQGA